MVNKRNKYNKGSNNRNNDSTPAVDEEGFTIECLELD